MSVITGQGKSVPPLKRHVIIYFMEKGYSENDALVFFRHFDERSWQNYQGGILSNWKMSAWEWILKNFILRKQQ